MIKSWLVHVIQWSSRLLYWANIWEHFIKCNYRISTWSYLAPLLRVNDINRFIDLLAHAIWLFYQFYSFVVVCNDYWTKRMTFACCRQMLTWWRKQCSGKERFANSLKSTERFQIVYRHFYNIIMFRYLWSIVVVRNAVTYWGWRAFCMRLLIMCVDIGMSTLSFPLVSSCCWAWPSVLSVQS